MKSANGSPNRAWSGRRRDNPIAEACPGRFERRWGPSRSQMPRWQLLSVIAALAVLGGIAFAVATDVVWALIFDQETYCEGQARAQQVGHGADFAATKEICDFWEF